LFAGLAAIFYAKSKHPNDNPDPMCVWTVRESC
jgi:hypothetical protein